MELFRTGFLQQDESTFLNYRGVCIYLFLKMCFLLYVQVQLYLRPFELAQQAGDLAAKFACCLADVLQALVLWSMSPRMVPPWIVSFPF